MCRGTQTHSTAPGVGGATEAEEHRISWLSDANTTAQRREVDRFKRKENHWAAAEDWLNRNHHFGKNNVTRRLRLNEQMTTSGVGMLVWLTRWSAFYLIKKNNKTKEQYIDGLKDLKHDRSWTETQTYWGGVAVLFSTNHLFFICTSK